MRITDQFDARFGVRFGRFTIDDFHGKHRILSVPEVYKYSSNIGTIQVMQQFGKDNFRAFLSKIGFDTQVPFELPEMRKPNVPAKFSEIVAATASFGHGLSISPLHMLRAVAGFVNDGNMVAPTIYQRTLEEAQETLRAGDLSRDQPRDPLPDAAQCAGRVRHAHEQVRQRLSRRRQDRDGRKGGWQGATRPVKRSRVCVGVPARQSRAMRWSSSSTNPQNENPQSGTLPAGMLAR